MLAQLRGQKADDLPHISPISRPYLPISPQVLAQLRGQKADDVSVLKELDFMQLGQARARGWGRG